MDEFWWKLLEQTLMAVLPVLAVAVTGWIIQKIREAEKRIGAERMTHVRWAAEMAVQAAEQAGLAGFIQDKKAHALQAAEAWLKGQGIRIDLDVLAEAVEAAVWSEINSKKTAGK